MKRYILFILCGVLFLAVGCRSTFDGSGYLHSRIEEPGPQLLKDLQLPEQVSIRTVMLDPGHGGDDSGAVGSRHQEKMLNLLLAQAVRTELVRRGFRVLMTRDGDTAVSLDRRAEMGAAADIFISIHHNSAARRDAAGIETFAPRPGHRFNAPSLLLAVMVQEKMISAGGTVDRGVKFAGFRVLAKARVPAILLEAGFVSNPAEEALCATPERRAALARAIADAVAEYRSVVQRLPVVKGK